MSRSALGAAYLVLQRPSTHAAWQTLGAQESVAEHPAESTAFALPAMRFAASTPETPPQPVRSVPPG